jgi:hypothetical protein
VRGTDGLDRRYFTKQKTHHVEHVDRRFVKKATGNFGIADPLGIEQFAAIHFHMRRMRLPGLAQHALKLSIDGSEPAIMTNLKNPVALVRCLQHPPRVSQARGHRLFAEDVFTFFGSQDGQFSVFRVRRGDVNRVAVGEHFGHTVRNLGADAARHEFRARFFDVMNGRNLHALVPREN